MVLARSGLDHEAMPSYTVTLRLNTLPGLASPQGQVMIIMMMVMMIVMMMMMMMMMTQEAVVRVEVLDRNDNPPVWQQEQGDRGGLVPPSVQLVSVSPGWRLAPAWQSCWPRTGTAGSWAG